MTSVLLVEDDKVVQKIHAIMLQKIGCSVDIASDGGEALKLFDSKKGTVAKKSMTGNLGLLL